MDELFEIIKQGGSAALPNNFIARSDGKILRFFKADRTKETNIAPPSVLLSTEQDLLFLNKRYTPHILTQQEFLQNQKIHKNLLDFSIDYDMISGSVYLRTRKGGDSFRPYKRNCTKTLKKFFQEQNIPAKQRNRVPILCDDRGILAVIGYGIDERAAVTERTNHILYIETSPERSE